MMLSVLSAAFIWSLLFGHIPQEALIALCVFVFVSLLLLGKDRHTRFFMIDVLAQMSRLNKVSPSLKFYTALMLMSLCLMAKSPLAGILLSLIMSIFIVYIGGLQLREYVRILTLPVSFLMMSALVLLFDVASAPRGVFAIPIFDFWLCVSPRSQANAALVVSRALGALSCLYMVSLTTPMSDLIGVLRRARCPDIIIELMYLIYRYIFVLFSMYHTMKDAANSRLGYVNYRAALRTTGNIYSNLMARSYRQANKNFDAMESRCYGTQIRFLENKIQATPTQTAAAIAVILITSGAIFLLKY